MFVLSFLLLFFFLFFLLLHCLYVSILLLEILSFNCKMFPIHPFKFCFATIAAYVKLEKLFNNQNVQLFKLIQLCTFSF